MKKLVKQKNPSYASLKLFKSVSLALIGIFLLALESKANYKSPSGTLHFIIVIDSTDPKIGTEIDYQNMEEIGELIDQETDLVVKWYVFEKVQNNKKIKKFKKYTAKRPEKKIERNNKRNYSIGNWELNDLVHGQGLKIEVNDVIWFYYSGHGEVSDQTKAPAFVAINPVREFYDFEDVHTSLLKKNPRLLITIYDCCSCLSTKEDKNVAELIVARRGITKRLEKLFLYASGQIQIKAADPNKCSENKFAYGNSKIGGILTYTFQSILKGEKKLEEESWDSVLKKTKNTVESFVKNKKKRQIPYIYSDVKYRQLFYRK
ncbi:MAG: caspase family protein [Bacteroidota bacterium]